MVSRNGWCDDLDSGNTNQSVTQRTEAALIDFYSYQLIAHFVFLISIGLAICSFAFLIWSLVSTIRKRQLTIRELMIYAAGAGVTQRRNGAKRTGAARETEGTHMRRDSELAVDGPVDEGEADRGTELTSCHDRWTELYSGLVVGGAEPVSNTRQQS